LVPFRAIWFGDFFCQQMNLLELSSKRRSGRTNKKIIAILAIAIFAISAYSVLADTWIDKQMTITFTGDSAGGAGTPLVGLGIFSDCALATPVPGVGVTAHDFGNVMQGNTYEWAIYVVNNGAEQVYLSYLPTTITGNGGQIAATLSVTAIAYGLPCETSGTTLAPGCTNALPYNLPEKNVATPTNGFLLMPNKVVKLDVQLHVTSVDEGVLSTVTFQISGVSVTVQE